MATSSFDAHFLPGRNLPLHSLVVSANAPSLRRPLTKAVVTIGPPCWDPTQLALLIKGGATGFRINASHITEEAHLIKAVQDVLMIRYLAAQQGREVAIFADMKGPEFRTIAEKKGIRLKVGDKVKICTTPGVSRREGKVVIIHLESPEDYQLIRDLKKHNKERFSGRDLPKVLIGDAKVTIELNSWDTLFDKSEPDYAIWGTVKAGDLLENRKGINFPNLSLPSLTGMTSADAWVLDHIFNRKFIEGAWELLLGQDDKLRDFVKDADQRGIFHYLGFDYVAPSFVRSLRDLNRFRDYLELKQARHVGLIPKIETDEASQPDVLMELLTHPLTRGVMAARGDLGALVGLREVPRRQRRILEMARLTGQFSIVATNVLASMVGGNLTGTRPEHDGLFSLMEWGADCMMFSDETASGKDPVGVLNYAMGSLLHMERDEPELSTGLLAQGFSPDDLRHNPVRLKQREQVMQAAQAAYDRRISGFDRETRLREDMYLEQMRRILGIERDRHVDFLALWSHRGESAQRAAQLASVLPTVVVTDEIPVARRAALFRALSPVRVRERPSSPSQLREVVESVLSIPEGEKAAEVRFLHNFNGD